MQIPILWAIYPHQCFIISKNKHFLAKIAQQLNKDLNPVLGMVAKPSKKSPRKGVFLHGGGEMALRGFFIREAKTKTDSLDPRSVDEYSHEKVHPNTTGAIARVSLRLWLRRDIGQS